MKILVFGKPGGGKSTLARQIATIAKLPLQPLDLLQYEQDGSKVPEQEFVRRYSAVLAQHHWVVDGFGSPLAFAAMLRAADMLVYVERPRTLHYWWVTKRLLQSPFVKPLGWPEGSPMLKSTLSSYRFLWLSDRFWTPAFKARLLAMQPEKRVYLIHRKSDVRSLLSDLERLAATPQAH
jgi:adenylate kinase family enzyme